MCPPGHVSQGAMDNNNLKENKCIDKTNNRINVFLTNYWYYIKYIPIDYFDTFVEDVIVTILIMNHKKEMDIQ